MENWFSQLNFTKILFFQKISAYVGEQMKKYFPIVFLGILLISALIVVGGTSINPTEDDGLDGNVYTFPLSVADNIYVVTVRSNSTAAPTVSYSGIDVLKIVTISLMGDTETAFCNVTIPNDLIWGELSLVFKYYEMDEAYYTRTSNSTHTSFYFEYYQIVLIKHFELRGTEGISEPLTAC